MILIRYMIQEWQIPEVQNEVLTMGKLFFEEKLSGKADSRKQFGIIIIVMRSLYVNKGVNIWFRNHNICLAKSQNHGPIITIGTVITYGKCCLVVSFVQQDHSTNCTSITKTNKQIGVVHIVLQPYITRVLCLCFMSTDPISLQLWH